MFRGVANWYPRDQFVLPAMLVRSVLQIRHHQLSRPGRWRQDRKSCVLTADVTRGTNCTKARAMLDRGLHVDHNEPTTSDGWPGWIPGWSGEPEQRSLF
jgi:hypothetical protein